MICKFIGENPSDCVLCITSRASIYYVMILSIFAQELHHYKSFFGQVQDLIFHPDNQTFFSAAAVLKRNSLDKAIIAWDYKSTAIISNQISQVSNQHFTVTVAHNPK